MTNTARMKSQHSSQNQGIHHVLPLLSANHKQCQEVWMATSGLLAWQEFIVPTMQLLFVHVFFCILFSNCHKCAKEDVLGDVAKTSFDISQVRCGSCQVACPVSSNPTCRH